MVCNTARLAVKGLKRAGTVTWNRTPGCGFHTGTKVTPASFCRFSAAASFSASKNGAVMIWNGCVLPRAKVHWRAMRSAPPAAPRNLQRLPGTREFASADAPSTVEGLADFAASLKMVERVEVAPFHKLGEFKWQELRMRYELAGTEPPTTESLLEVRRQFSSRGLTVV